MSGQINRNSEVGQKIYELSQQKDVRNIVDIGTWNGLGSTKCVVDGLMDSNALIDSSRNFNFISIEANYEKYLEAKENLKEFLLFVDLFFGRITEEKDLINLDDYPERFFRKYSKDTQKEWFKESIREHKETPLVLHKLPKFIDLLILDGGEYCSWAEFKLLRDRSKYIVLDDTETLKNYDAASYIRYSPNDFDILEDNTTSRNGYMIARNKNEYNI